MLKEQIAKKSECISYLRNYLVNLAFKLGKWRYLPIFVILIIGITLPYLLGTVQVSYSITNGGVIKEINVKIYNDNGCSVSLPSIDWGLLEAGSSINRTIYVKNEGNSPLMLTLNASNWIPLNAANYITLTWDYDRQPLNPNQFIKVVLMLVISPTIRGISSFTFDITVIGKG